MSLRVHQNGYLLRSQLIAEPVLVSWKILIIRSATEMADKITDKQAGKKIDDSQLPD